jgi:hypothetical protein
MYKNIERKQRIIEQQNDSSDISSSVPDESSSSRKKNCQNQSKIGLVNQNIFNSTFINSILKTNKKKYDVMNLEDVLHSFVRHSMSHNDLSSFLNESNYSVFSKANTKNVTPQKSAVDLLAQQHKYIQANNRLRKKGRNSIEADTHASNRPLQKKTTYKPYYDRNRMQANLLSKKGLLPKRPIVNNYVPKRNNDKIKVEIDLPMYNEENQLKYSLLTNSSEGQKIIYLKRKDGSKETSKESSKDNSKESSKDRHDPEEAINRFNEGGDIIKKRTAKKAPIKNAKAFLTSSFPKTMKSESQKSTNSGGDEMGTLKRFS